MSLRPLVLLLFSALGMASAVATAQPAGAQGEPGSDAVDPPDSEPAPAPAPKPMEPVRIADRMLEPPTAAALQVRSWGDALRYVRDGSTSLRTAR